MTFQTTLHAYMQQPNSWIVKQEKDYQVVHTKPQEDATYPFLMQHIEKLDYPMHHPFLNKAYYQSRKNKEIAEVIEKLSSGILNKKEETVHPFNSYPNRIALSELPYSEKIYKNCDTLIITKDRVAIPIQREKFFERPHCLFLKGILSRARGDYPILPLAVDSNDFILYLQAIYKEGDSSNLRLYQVAKSFGDVEIVEKWEERIANHLDEVSLQKIASIPAEGVFRQILMHEMAVRFHDASPTDLSRDDLEIFLETDFLPGSTLPLFQFLEQWVKIHKPSDEIDLFRKVNYKRMSRMEFVTQVMQPKKVFSQDEVLRILDQLSKKVPKKYFTIDKYKLNGWHHFEMTLSPDEIGLSSQVFKLGGNFFRFGWNNVGIGLRLVSPFKKAFSLDCHSHTYRDGQMVSSDRITQYEYVKAHQMFGIKFGSFNVPSLELLMKDGTLNVEFKLRF